MQTSYRQMIAEHEQIEGCAAELLADIDDGTVGAADLAVQLGDLARLVSDHIEVENGIIEHVDGEKLSGPWSEAWGEGQAAFLRLRTDWIAFLGQWNAAAIENDRGGFIRSAHAILDRLCDRLAIETRAFYATALQTGSIALR